MGEIASDIKSGRMCTDCGCYFKKEGVDRDSTEDFNEIVYQHGYPATCWDCWKSLSKMEKKTATRAQVETI